MNRSVCIIAMIACVVGCEAPRDTGSLAAQAALAHTLGELGSVYLDRVELARAEPLLTSALALRESVLGPMHPEVAHDLTGLAELHRVREHYAEAEPLLLRALDIHDRAQVTAHAGLVTTLYSLADSYRARGALEKAEPLYVRALDIAENALGPMHPETGRALAGLALYHRDRGAYGKAEPLYVRALEIAEKVFGVAHPEVARRLNGLGCLYRLLAAYDKARALDTRALGIVERALGPWHPEAAQSLHELGSLDWYRSAYASAETRYSRALAIRETAFGSMHSGVGTTLSNLAMVAHDRGEDARAERLYRRSIEITESMLGPMHPRLALMLNNFAVLYWNQGSYKDAERLVSRILDIYEKAPGPVNDNLALTLNLHGKIKHIQEDYPAAESSLMRAIEITRNTLGPTHPDLATFLNNLAWLYRDQRMYGKAEPLLTRALEISEKNFGPWHYRNAGILESLGSVNRDQKKFDKAEPFVLRAFGIREKLLTPVNPLMVIGLYARAKLHWVQGAFDKVEPLLSRAADIREDQLHNALPRMSEPRKRALMTFLQIETDSVVSLHVHGLPRSQRALELALTTILRRKGRVVDSMVDSAAALRNHVTPRLREQLDQLDRARSELVDRLYAQGEATDTAAIAAIRARIEDLEGALSAASAAFRVQSEPVTLANVRAAIPDDAALVEFVRYHRYDPSEVQPSREERYAAYVVTRSGPPQWVALGPAARIDAHVDAMRAAMDDNRPVATANAALRRLDALVLAPIRARLEGASQLILAPDGKLHLVPFEALVDARGRLALDSYLISYVTTGRDLLRLAVPHELRSAGMVLAGPDYGPLPSSSKIAFAPLTEALGEAADLERYFSTPPLTGEKATKAALKQLAGPAILHVATHGFYARASGSKPMPASGNPSREMFAELGGALLPPPRPDDPADGLDLAGLAMAGANQGPAGIVTAREIAGLDWWGTQLVVLSACETGVGAVPSGDGVYGMRRALVLAGAASQVVSLWAVDDASTRMLMRDYYAELALGTGRAEALRAAKRRLMHEPRYAHPHHWAAFIPAGDWRPLDRDAIVQ
jgi:CHAT domain-containing protein